MIISTLVRDGLKEYACDAAMLRLCENGIYGQLVFFKRNSKRKSTSWEQSFFPPSSGCQGNSLLKTSNEGTGRAASRDVEKLPYHNNDLCVSRVGKSMD